ncbi:MAG: MFS transporter [Tenericutes bacterium]|nr:MFS transporter [Mycoplasmatota bacterium]
MEEQQAKRRPTIKNVFSYAVGDLYGGGAFFIIGALFLIFLTDVAGMSPALAGAVILIGKVWDAISDPTMGYISDNTRSKHGRRRIYFLIGILPIFLSWFLLWSNFGVQSEVGKFIYYLLVYLLFNTAFTLVMVPYNAMPAEMATNYKDRSKLITVRMAFSQGGMLLGAVLPLTIVGFFGTPSVGYMVMATVFGLLFSIPWIFVFRGTYEQVRVLEEPKKLKANEIAKKISKEFGSTVKNKSLRVQISMYIAAFVSMDVFNALLIFYIRDYIYKGIDMGGNYQILLGIVVVFQMLSLIIVMKNVNKFGNAKTYRIHALSWFAALIALIFVPPGAVFYVVLVIGVVIGFGLSGCVMTPYNMLAFVVDADEMITTKRREGTYAGVMTFLRKIAQALALFLVGLGLEYFGYVAPINDIVQIQSDATLNGIRLVFFIAPLTLIILGVISSLRFKITPNNHKILMSEIERLKNGGSKKEVNNKTREVCEAITGLDYKDLYIKEAE